MNTDCSGVILLAGPGTTWQSSKEKLMDPHPTQESLRDGLGQPGQAAHFKAISQLDVHCENILALSPFVVVATASADGSCDASPRGGPPGFIRVLSPIRVAIGELPGNRLFDGAQNLAENPWAALLVMIPGVNETLRIEGHAAMSTDEDIRAATSLDGKVPWGALVIDIVKIFTHCGKALKRSQLWEPASWPPLDQRPRMGAVIAAHMAAPGPDGSIEPSSTEAIEAGLQESYEKRLW